MSEEEKELIKNCKIWIDEEDINYTRWFGLNELAILIKLIEKLRIKNGKEFVRGIVTERKVWKAKIKSKIKELEKLNFNNYTNEYDNGNKVKYYILKKLKEIIGW